MNIELSDLFFNHDHPEYDELCRVAAREKPDKVRQLFPSRDDEIVAITKDAQDFISRYPAVMAALGPNVSANDLATDFLTRL